MISCLLAVTNTVPSYIAYVFAVIEGISVSLLCISRIIKTVIQIKQVLKDDNKDDLQQIQDVLKETADDLKNLTSDKTENNKSKGDK